MGKKIWRRKQERWWISPKNEEIDKNKLMDETPNKKFEIHSFAYEEEQAQGRGIYKEEDEDYYGEQNNGDDDELLKSNPSVE